MIDADALFQSYLDTDKQADLIKYEEDKLKAGGNGDFFPGFYTAVMIFRDLINEAPTIGGWISVKERLPQDEQWVAALLYGLVGYNTILLQYNAMLNEFITDDGIEYDIDDVAYWVGLPEPPEETKGEEE